MSSVEALDGRAMPTAGTLPDTTLPEQAGPDAMDAMEPMEPMSPMAQDRLDRPAAASATDPAASDPRIPALEVGMNQLRERLDAKDMAEAEEARKPGFFQALLEALELMLRWFTPFVNLL